MRGLFGFALWIFFETLVGFISMTENAKRAHARAAGSDSADLVEDVATGTTDGEPAGLRHGHLTPGARFLKTLID